jgi:hypothetical protein
MFIHHKLIEEITLTGPMEEKQQAYDYCDKHGFKITSDGHLRVGRTKINISRFCIVAARRVIKDKDAL